MCRPGHGSSRGPSAGGHIGPPLRKTGRFPQPPGPAAHSGASASAGARKWVGIAAEIIPKGAINLGQSLSHGEAVTAPFAQGSLGTGDADCRVGPAGLLAMTMVFCHSEERSDVGIRPFYDGRGFGPPYLGHGLRQPNSVLSIGPPRRRPLRKGGIAAATTQASGAQRSVCAADARDGRESAQRPSQKGDRPATAWAALSEAESAERAAGQIQSLPDTLRVQHGV